MPKTPHAAALLEGSVSNLLAAYRSREITPGEVIDHIVATSAAMADNPIWITPPDKVRLKSYLDQLAGSEPGSLPLWGVPFAVKDNIDVAGMPTTAACPDYAYQPVTSAFVVQCLIDAGAIPVGKTNLDQFATGLVGVALALRRTRQSGATRPHSRWLQLRQRNRPSLQSGELCAGHRYSGLRTHTRRIQRSDRIQIVQGLAFDPWRRACVSKPRLRHPVYSQHCRCCSRRQRRRHFRFKIPLLEPTPRIMRLVLMSNGRSP